MIDFYGIYKDSEVQLLCGGSVQKRRWCSEELLALQRHPREHHRVRARGQDEGREVRLQEPS